MYLTTSIIVPLHVTGKTFVALSLLGSGYGIGATISLYMVRAILESFGYQAMFITLASLSFLTCITGLLYFSPNNHSTVNDTTLAQAAGLDNEGFENFEIRPHAEETGNSELKTSNGTSSTQSHDNEKNNRNRIAIFIRKELGMLASPIFLAIVTALVGNEISHSLTQFKVVSMTERGLSNNEAAFYFTSQAVADILLTHVLGSILSLPSVKPFMNYLYAGMVIISGAFEAIFGFITVFGVVIPLGVVGSVVKTAIYDQITGVLVELCGREKMQQYTPVIRVFQGIANLATPLLAG